MSMSNTSELPNLPAWKSLLMFIRVDFMFRPVHYGIGRVVNKRYISGFPGGAISNMPALPPAWYVEFQTPHGNFEIEVSREFFELVGTGHPAVVRYSISRWTQELNGSLTR